MPRWTAWVRRAAPSLSNARAQCVFTVFSETKSCVAIFAVAEAAGDQGEDFKLACRNAEGLLLGGIGSELLEGGGFAFPSPQSFRGPFPGRFRDCA